MEGVADAAIFERNLPHERGNGLFGACASPLRAALKGVRRRFASSSKG